jgi:predicted TIM-barrel fold metal-dependent hydrolase
LKLPQASDHLRRFHCDLAMHDPRLTRLRIDLVGADRVVCDSDFPKGVAIKKPAEYVESIPNITDNERQLVFCENAARLRH